jgi:hypothetical protein
MTDNAVTFSRPRLPDMTESDRRDLNLLAGAILATRRAIAVEWDRGDEGCQYLTVELPRRDWGLLGDEVRERGLRAARSRWCCPEVGSSAV